VQVRNGPPGLNLEPDAWAHHRKDNTPFNESPYPAQVRWQAWKVCRPIREELWKHIPTVKNRSGGSRSAIYDMWMTADQARELARICLRHG